MSTQVSGTVKWFDDAKGFGFIQTDDSEKDVFVHYSSINSSGRKTLQNGQKVTLSVENGQKGLQASSVTPL